MGWRRAFLGLALGAATFLLGCGRGVTAHDRAIGARALAEAKALVAAHPRREAGVDSAQVAAWLAGRFTDPKARIISFETPHGAMANVWRDCPTHLGPPVAILASHFDTKRGIPGFVGANDGASTTGLLIALAELSDLPVIYLLLDGEECKEEYSAHDGLHGSWHAARGGLGLPKRLPVFVLDMLGDADFTPALAANGSPALNALLRRAAKDVGVPLGEAGDIIDDHVPFVVEGWRAADVIDFDYGPGNGWWHTAEDTPEKLSAASLARAAALVRRTVELLKKERK